MSEPTPFRKIAESARGLRNLFRRRPVGPYEEQEENYVEKDKLEVDEEQEEVEVKTEEQKLLPAKKVKEIDENTYAAAYFFLKDKVEAQGIPFNRVKGKITQDDIMDMAESDAHFWLILDCVKKESDLKEDIKSKVDGLEDVEAIYRKKVLAIRKEAADKIEALEKENGEKMKEMKNEIKELQTSRSDVEKDHSIYSSMTGFELSENYSEKLSAIKNRQNLVTVLPEFKDL